MTAGKYVGKKLSCNLISAWNQTVGVISTLSHIVHTMVNTH